MKQSTLFYSSALSAKVCELLLLKYSPKNCIYWFIWYAQLFIGTSACPSLDKMINIWVRSWAMAEDEKWSCGYTPVDRYPTGRDGLMLTADADQNRHKFPLTPRWRWLIGHHLHFYNRVHNRRDVWWCTTSRKDKHKPFEVWGWAAVLDSFSDQRCCAASGRRGFQQQMVYVFVRENNQPTRTMGSKPRFRIWYLCLI